MQSIFIMNSLTNSYMCPSSHELGWQDFGDRKLLLNFCMPQVHVETSILQARTVKDKRVCFENDAFFRFL